MKTTIAILSLVLLSPVLFLFTLLHMIDETAFALADTALNTIKGEQLTDDNKESNNDIFRIHSK